MADLNARSVHEHVMDAPEVIPMSRVNDTILSAENYASQFNENLQRSSSHSLYRKLSGISDLFEGRELEGVNNEKLRIKDYSSIPKEVNVTTIRKIPSSARTKTLIEIFNDGSLNRHPQSRIFSPAKSFQPINIDKQSWCDSKESFSVQMVDDVDDEDEIDESSRFDSKIYTLEEKTLIEPAKSIIFKKNNKPNDCISLSRLDSDTKARLREGEDKFPGDSNYSITASAISNRQSLHEIFNTSEQKKFDDSHQQQSKTSCLKSDLDQSSKKLDSRTQAFAVTEMQALGRKLGYVRKKSNADGEWGMGLEDPWKIRGRITLFLILLGLIHGTTAKFIDSAINALGSLRLSLIEHRGKGTAFVIYAAFNIVGTAIAALITAGLEPGAAGSGIPMMKWMLGTDDIKNKSATRFTFRCWLVKGIGLILASGSGLNIGREGPFVHMAGMLSFQLSSNLSMFKTIFSSESLLRQVFVASTSLGVSSVFSAVIGGVLLAVEITSTYYLVAQYFKGFLAAICGVLTVKLIEWCIASEKYALETVVTTDFTSTSYTMVETLAFLLLGLAGSLIGPLYVSSKNWFASFCMKISKGNLKPCRDGPNRKKFIVSSVILAIILAFVTAVLSFFEEFNRIGPFEMYSDLMSNELPDRWSNDSLNKWGALFIALTTRWITAAIGTTICVPAGDFIQTSVLGALLGRIVGTAVKEFYPEANPAVYALVGSATFSGGATQSISAAVVLMEFSGSFILEVPVLMAVLVAYAVSRTQGLNMYDSVMKANGLKSLQGLKFDTAAVALKQASDIMITSFRALSSFCTVEDLISALEEEKTTLNRNSFPVVSDMKNMAYLGTISRKHVATLVHQECSANDNFSMHARSRIPDEMMCFDHEGDSMRISQTLQSIYSHLRNHSLSFVRGEGHRNSLSPAFRKRHSLSQSPKRRHSIPAKLNLSILNQSDWDEDRFVEALKVNFLSKKIDLIAEDQKGVVFIDPTTWTVPENMPLGHLHVLFELLRATRLFVVAGGQLKGIITRDTIYDALSSSIPTYSQLSLHRTRSDLPK